MASVFRKSSMERLQSPDKLDCMLKVTSPLSWLGILCGAVLAVILIVWSVCGRIPQTVSATGFLVSSYHTNTVFCSAAGQVTGIQVEVGDALQEGDVILTITDTKGREIEVRSGQEGIVSEVLVQQGGLVTPNQEIMRISPETENALSVVCYVDLGTAKRLRKGMEARIYPSSLDSGKYGYLLGEVTNMDSYVSSNTAINELLGADGQMAYALTANGPVVAVCCRLANDARNASGYAFSSPNARQAEVSGGEQAAVQLVLEEDAPISKVFPSLGGN